MLTGVPPFSGKDDKAILMKVSKGLFSLKLPEMREVSTEAKDLLSKMLEKDKNKRFSAEECLRHPWFQRVTDSSMVSKTTLNKALMNLNSFHVIMMLYRHNQSFNTLHGCIWLAFSQQSRKRKNF